MLAETNRQAPVYLLVPAVLTDGYGDPLNDWDNATPVLIPGADLQAHASLDVDQAVSSTTKRTGTLIATGTALDVYQQITPDSRIRQGSTVWRINGQPTIKLGRIFGNTHLVASLTRTTVEAPNA